MAKTETEGERVEVQKRKKSRRPINSYEFVKAWSVAASVREVAEKTGMRESEVRARAKSYRERKVDLPELHGEGSARFDAEALNALLKE